MASTYEPVGWCPRCGYRMDAGDCPECGRRVARPARRDPRSWRRWLVRWGVRLGVIAAVGWLSVMAAYRWMPTRWLRQVRQTTGRFSLAAEAILAWRTEQDREVFNLAVRRISNQLAQRRSHEWAGTYVSVGVATTSRLMLGPSREYVGWDFVCGHFSCTSGLVVTSTDSLLTLKSTDSDLDSLNPDEVYSRFHRIRWGHRYFLAPQAASFDPGDGDDVEITLGSLMWGLRTRLEDADGPLEGWPELPPVIANHFVGFPETLAVVDAFEVIEDRDDFDPDQGDASYSDTVNRTVFVFLDGDMCLPDMAEVAGLYATLPSTVAFNDGDVMRIETDLDAEFPLPKIGWRFAILNAEWENDSSNAEAEGESELVPENDRSDS